MGQQQDGGGLGQFFRGDLPQKLGTLLVSWRRRQLRPALQHAIGNTHARTMC